MVPAKHMWPFLRVEIQQADSVLPTHEGMGNQAGDFLFVNGFGFLKTRVVERVVTEDGAVFAQYSPQDNAVHAHVPIAGQNCSEGECFGLGFAKYEHATICFCGSESTAQHLLIEDSCLRGAVVLAGVRQRSARTRSIWKLADMGRASVCVWLSISGRGKNTCSSSGGTK